MDESLTLNSWAVIRDNCPIRFIVKGSAEADVRCGLPSDGLEITIESEALRELVRQATEALRDMDDQFAQEEAQRLAAT